MGDTEKKLAAAQKGPATVEGSGGEAWLAVVTWVRGGGDTKGGRERRAAQGHSCQGGCKQRDSGRCEHPRRCRSRSQLPKTKPHLWKMLGVGGGERRAAATRSTLHVSAPGKSPVCSGANISPRSPGTKPCIECTQCRQPHTQTGAHRESVPLPL